MKGENGKLKGENGKLKGERWALYFMLKCESVKKRKRDLESAFEVKFANHV